MSYSRGVLAQGAIAGHWARRCHAEGGTLRVLALGASSTLGIMNCAGARCVPDFDRRWSSVLQSQLAAALSPCTVEVVNAARGGLTSASALALL
eukprot:3188739-Prymnesium_polylepis.1